MTARQDALGPVAGDQVSGNDVAVFANQELVKLISRRGAPSAKKHEGLSPDSDIPAGGGSQQSEESFKRLVREAVEAAAKRVSGRKRSQQSSNPPSKARRDPYEILGVPRGASAGELKQARDRQIEIAHPDKLHQFHPALIARATELTAEINWAYDTLKKNAAA